MGKKGNSNAKCVCGGVMYVFGMRNWSRKKGISWHRRKDMYRELHKYGLVYSSVLVKCQYIWRTSLQLKHMGSKCHCVIFSYFTAVYLITVVCPSGPLHCTFWASWSVFTKLRMNVERRPQSHRLWFPSLIWVIWRTCECAVWEWQWYRLVFCEAKTLWSVNFSDWHFGSVRS